jgi:histidyl-tRNA synthetase
MDKVEARVLKGFRDYLPSEMIARARMLEVIERTFRSFGFLPLMTPALEYADVLLGKYGDEGDSLLYRFLDNGERDVALRYDLTVPLARVVAQYPELPRPFKRYQVAPVWRAEKPARGRFREFVQCDGDIAGSEDLLADAEVIQLGAAMLDGLGVKSFRIQVNNRKVLAGMLDRAGLGRGKQELDVLRTVDKLPKIGEEKTRELLRIENGLDERQIGGIFEFLSIAGTTAEVIRRSKELFEAGSVGRRGVEELEEVFGILDAVGLEGRAAVDLSIARGLNYYTGTIYESFLGELPGFGAVMSGGRYDGLIGAFAREEIPAVGISLGLDRLLAGLRELKVIEECESTAAVLVTVFDGASRALSARLAGELRAAGIACELFPQAAKISKQLRYAERTGKRVVVIAGPDEAARQCAQVKDLASRAQVEVPIAGLAEKVSSLLSL